MYGSGRPAISVRTQATRRFRIPNTRRCSSELNTKFCAVGHRPRVPAPSATAFAIGTTRSAGKCSPDSVVLAMPSANLVNPELSPQIVAPRRRQILADVREGLSRMPRELSPKYFYDERGSHLFEEITRLPEYYLTRAEREILVARANDIARMTNARTLVELGA